MSHIQHELPVPPKSSWWQPYWESFKKHFPDQFGKQLALWLLAFLGFAGVWLWGWIVGGGMTRVIGSIPPGAVVAFRTECPKQLGWSPFKEGTGRMIVGAGDTYAPGFENWYRELGDGKTQAVPLKPSAFQLMQQGGELNHQLTASESNSRDHAIQLSQKGDYHRGQGGYPGIESVKYIEALGAQPHNTMPPFIGLYFCQKD